LASLGAFVGGQFGVFGPIPFAVLLGGAVWLAARRRLTPQDALLLCFALPPLLIVTLQAFISRANANWAAAAYAPGAVLVAAWLMRWGARRWLVAALALQSAVALGALAVLAKPDIADRVGAANSLKRLRGWREATTLIVERARTESLASPLSAVAVDDRFLFNAAAYYGREYFGTEGPPLRFWTAGGPATTQAALQAPLTIAEGARVLGVSFEGRSTAAMEASFQKSLGREIDSLQLDRKHRRRIDLFLGEGYRGPAPPAAEPPKPPP
jgi:4-amino-4-deoxy-L-arabinose transferase-like glycosyltransferase